MRIRRRITAWVLGIGVAIGAWFSGLLPGFGSGSGDGDGVPTGQPVSVSTDPPAGSQPADTTNTAAKAGAEAAESEEPARIRRLVVYVDGDEYAVPVADGGVRRLSEEMILYHAARTTGDQDGIRVLVLLTKDARYSAWSRLVDDLVKNDIPRASISIPEDMAELPVKRATSES